MTNLTLAQAAQMKGRDLVDLLDLTTGKKYRRVSIGPFEKWVFYDSTTKQVAILSSLGANIAYVGQLDQEIKDFIPLEQVGSDRERLESGGYKVLADHYGWQARKDGEIIEDRGYQGQQDAVPRFSRPIQRKNLALGWIWIKSNHS